MQWTARQTHFLFKLYCGALLALGPPLAYSLEDSLLIYHDAHFADSNMLPAFQNDTPARVVGAPYSAVGTFHSTRWPGDRAERRAFREIRDSQGRTRTEYLRPPPLSPEVYDVHVNDPTRGERYKWSKFEQHYYVLPFKSVPLGEKALGGIPASGMRLEYTIPGKERPIKLVSEQWYSSELGVVMMSRMSLKVSPALSLESTYELQVKREEPDASLFKVPPEYTQREIAPAHTPELPIVRD